MSFENASFPSTSVICVAVAFEKDSVREVLPVCRGSYLPCVKAPDSRELLEPSVEEPFCITEQGDKVELGSCHFTASQDIPPKGPQSSPPPRDGGAGASMEEFPDPETRLPGSPVCTVLSSHRPHIYLNRPHSCWCWTYFVPLLRDTVL